MTWSSSPSISRSNFWSVTNVFVGACCAVYVVAAISAGSISDPVATAVWTPMGSTSQTLGWRMLFDAGTVTAFGEWWRILTAALIHLNLGHLFFNMILIFLLGRELEKTYGATVMASLIVASASAGAIACMLFEPSVAVGGASTVAYGMFAMIVGLARARGESLVAPLVLIAVNLGYSLVGSVSLWGHLGGLAAGAILAGVMAQGRPRGGGWLVASAPGADNQQKTATAVVAAAMFGLSLWMGLGGHYPVEGLLATSSPWS